MKKMRWGKWIGAVTLGVAVFGAAGVEADTITTGGAFPDTAEIIAATAAESTFGDDANVSLAQTFSLDSAFSARAIYLAYENDDRAVTDWTMTVSIFEVADVTAAGLVPAGDDVYTGTFTFPYVEAGTVARLDLTTPLSLNASVGTGGYAIQIAEAAGADFNPGWEWLRPTSAVYDGGAMYEDGLLKNAGERDLSLAISSIPEPGTLGLLGISAIGAFAIRRFKV